MKEKFFTLLKIRNMTLIFFLGISVFFYIQCGNSETTETNSKDDDSSKLKNQSKFDLINLTQDASKANDISNRIYKQTKKLDDADLSKNKSNNKFNNKSNIYNKLLNLLSNHIGNLYKHRKPKEEDVEPADIVELSSNRVSENTKLQQTKGKHYLKNRYTKCNDEQEISNTSDKKSFPLSIKRKHGYHRLNPNIIKRPLKIDLEPCNRYIKSKTKLTNKLDLPINSYNSKNINICKTKSRDLKLPTKSKSKFHKKVLCKQKKKIFKIGKEEKEESIIKNTMLEIMSEEFYTQKDMDTLREDFNKVINYSKHYICANDTPSFIDNVYLNYITEKNKYSSKFIEKCKSKMLGVDAVLCLKIFETINKYSKIKKVLKYKSIKTINDLNNYHTIFIGISSFIGTLKNIIAYINKMKLLKGKDEVLMESMKQTCGLLDDLNRNFANINKLISGIRNNTFTQFFKNKRLKKNKPQELIVCKIGYEHMKQTKDYVCEIYDKLAAIHEYILEKIDKKELIDKQQYAVAIIMFTLELKIEMQMAKFILSGIFKLNTKECVDLRYNFVKNYLKLKDKYIEAMKIRNEIVVNFK